MIRIMENTDLVAVATIAQEVMPFPWSEATFASCLKFSYQNWVVVVEDRVVAFLITHVQLAECQIMNLGVTRALQRQRYASRLLIFLVEKMRIQGVKKIWLEVRKSNEAAQRLYENFEFEVVAVRKNYYRTNTGREDGVVMCKNVDL